MMLPTKQAPKMIAAFMLIEGMGYGAQRSAAAARRQGRKMQTGRTCRVRCLRWLYGQYFILSTMKCDGLGPAIILATERHSHQ